MSFDFDPNNNNDRAEVDNDPEDVESYLAFRRVNNNNYFTFSRTTVYTTST